jgi:hypothetical protein
VTQGASKPLEAEIEFASSGLERLFEEYANLWDKVQIGQIHNLFFDDLAEFVNLRFETLSSAGILLKNGRVADALSLCRTALEGLLLFQVITQGHSHLRLQKFEDKSQLEAAYKKAKELLDTGAASFVSVKKRRRDRLALQYEFKGLNYSEDEPLRIPLHYFLFQEHQPQSHRLKTWDYYSAIPIEGEFLRALNEQHENSKSTYNNYLSYQSLKESLELNHLIDSDMSKRLEAHYTFLGNFVHPTNNAARNLHERNNNHNGGTSIGLPNGYASEAILLGYLYVLNLAHSYIEMLVSLIKTAPGRYIAEFSSIELDELIADQRLRFEYFWFLSSKAPRYDKFRAALLPQLFKKYASNYLSIPDSQVPFDFRIYERFIQSLGGWSNSSIGTYDSPLKD